MFLHFKNKGDLGAFLDLLPKNLYNKTEIFPEDLSVFFFDNLSLSEKNTLKKFSTRLGATIYDQPTDHP